MHRRLDWPRIVGDYRLSRSREIELWSVMRTGDGAASGAARESLILSCYKLVFRILGKYAGYSDYEDILQSGMDALIRSVDAYDANQGRLSTYAGKAIYLYASRYVFLAKRERARLGLNSCDCIDSFPDRRGKEPDDVAETNLLRADVRHAVDELPPRLKDVIECRYLDDQMTLGGIGERLGVGKERVRQLETVAMRELGRKLEGVI